MIIISVQSGYDPLDDYSSHSRQLLCDALINAKQFTLKYQPAYHKNTSKDPETSLTDWDRSDSIDAIHYQRDVPDWSRSSYQLRSIRIARDDHEKIKSLQCVNMMSEKWFITYGLVDKYLYLLENSPNKRAFHLLMKGLFEPSAIINNQNLQNDFRDQLETSKGKLTNGRGEVSIQSYSFKSLLMLIPRYDGVHLSFRV